MWEKYQWITDTKQAKSQIKNKTQFYDKQKPHHKIDYNKSLPGNNLCCNQTESPSNRIASHILAYLGKLNLWTQLDTCGNLHA